MSEDQNKVKTAESEFEASINKILESIDFSKDDSFKEAEKKLNDFLRGINKINVSRDLVAHVYKDGTEPKIDIFCRNVRMDELALKLSILGRDPEVNKTEIEEIQRYIDSIRSIGLFQ
jgi:hypothetical protein